MSTLHHRRASRVQTRQPEEPKKDWKRLIDTLYPRNFDEMYKGFANNDPPPSEPVNPRELMTCPCCHGKGKIPQDYERMDAQTGFVHKIPDKQCLYCVGKGTV